MKNFTLKFALLTSVVASSITFTGAALAQTDVEIFKRCQTDSLTPTQARGRNDWSKSCGHMTRRDWDYYMYEDDGSLRPRPKYQSFFNPANFNDWLRAPTAVGASCDIRHYTKKFFCVSSCYTPDQKVLFAEGEFAIFDAFSKRMTNIVTLADEAGLHSLSYRVKDVEAYSESLMDIKHDILVFNTQSGGQLKVTENHPLLVSSGHMLNADKIKVGDSLISKDGHFDPIVSIDEETHFGKVYNVQPSTADKSLKGQIVVAQGFLSGSMYYQNEASDLTGRLMLRGNIPDYLL